ncbi:hypothetical protein JG688_00017876 [Phytophthora aleatoria]|uniref:Uncharacterized protein n=1 Tax=Phytophthora aleatoria TaxID=2496075 RepID=A0A8J5M120_9STRA|nr:hypothetical protein JG688_00017876 [Phytophthora aleatoria]
MNGHYVEIGLFIAWNQVESTKKIANKLQVLQIRRFQHLGEVRGRFQLKEPYEAKIDDPDIDAYLQCRRSANDNDT